MSTKQQRDKRDRIIVELLKIGYTLQDIADIFFMTEERIRQIVSRDAMIRLSTIREIERLV